MDGLTLRSTTSTTLQPGPDADPETTEGSLRVSLAENEIIVDDGQQVERMDFERRWVTTLRREARTARDRALLGLVHGRESGMASAIHVMQVLRAGGATLGGAVCTRSIRSSGTSTGSTQDCGPGTHTCSEALRSRRSAPRRHRDRKLADRPKPEVGHPLDRSEPLKVLEALDQGPKRGPGFDPGQRRA